MPEPLVFDLFARDAFLKGDYGWTTPKGVISVRDFSRLPLNSVPLRALDDTMAETWGRFEEVEVGRPKPHHA